MSFYHYRKSLVVAIGAFLLFGTASASCDLGHTCRLANPDPNVKIIPFSAPATTSISEISSHTVPGLAPNERLCPVKCPVGVEIPEGGKVLGCYDICKPIAPLTQLPTHKYNAAQSQHVKQTPTSLQSSRTEHVVQYEPYLVNPAVQTTHVRVIRPVIYVRYPVPVPVSPCGRIIRGYQPSC